MTTTFKFVQGLYGITPQTSNFDSLHVAVKQAAQGGMTTLQWRQKNLDLIVARQQALEMAKLCRTLGVAFIINDDIDLALYVDADGLHLGKEDGSARAARQRLGPNKIIGCSCYNDIGLAQAAIVDDADYVAFGAVFSSSVKPDAVRAPLSLFDHARQLVTAMAHKPVSLVAIGGITVDNAASVIDAGADSLAVIGGLFDQPNIHESAAKFAALF